MKSISHQIGMDAESRAARLLKGKRIPQSGGGSFWKLDIKDKGSFIWFVRASRRGVLRITGSMLREARQAARGVVGTGDKFTAGIITEVDGELGVFLPLTDFAEIVTADSDEALYLIREKNIERLRSAGLSPMSRRERYG
jgi:hypothetical protein